MKQSITLFVCAFLSFLSLFGQETDMSKLVENCMIHEYSKVGVDLIQTLSDYEDYLINKHFLKGKSGQDYLNYLKNAELQGDFGSLIPNSLFEKIAKVPPGKYLTKDCLHDLLKSEESDLANEGVSLKFLSLKSRIDSLMQVKKKVIPTDIITLYLNTFNSTDLENQHLRMNILLSIAWTSDIE